MDLDNNSTETKKVRNFPSLDLKDQSTLNATTHPVLVIQSPKTPTLSRKLKAVSLDSDPPKQSTSLEVSRDVFSMPNTPKRQIKQKLSCDFDDGGHHKTNLVPSFSSNLKKFASNNSISGSQTLKTLPEIMMLQDFSDNRTEPVKIKAKGLLERRGSNASLTIDLGSNSSISEEKPASFTRLNTAKSVSNLNLSSFGSVDKCKCIIKKCEAQMEKKNERRKSQEACGNCTIYESVPSKVNFNAAANYQPLQRRCSCCVKSRRKSLSNENLYVPPCGFCQTGAYKECTGTTKHCKGYRKAYYPRQPDLESSQLLSEDFKMHLQNIQYLQTAGNVLTVDELKQSCEMLRVPKLHQEFWEVPLNLQEKCYASGSQSKNRYRGVLPNEHSRVHLPGPQSYIHANYIKGPDYTETAYIATQGPMAHTCQEFWEMVWHSNSKCIVMLTGLIEKGRNKCELYFPLGKDPAIKEKSYFLVKTMRVRDKFTFDNKNNQLEEDLVEFEELNEVTFGNYKIKFLDQERLSDCFIRKLEFSRSDNLVDTRIIYHYWFPSWQDHKMANPGQVLEIALHVLNLIENDNNTTKTDISKPKEISRTESQEKPNSTNLEQQKPNLTLLRKQNDLNNQSCHDYSHQTKQKKDDVTASTRERMTDAKKTLKQKLSSGASGSERKKSAEKIRTPLIVHCSAGIGRTGCFLAVLNGIQQLRNNLNVDVLAILCSLRLNRGGMVQTAEQYELIHRVLSLYTDMM